MDRRCLTEFGGNSSVAKAAQLQWGWPCLVLSSRWCWQDGVGVEMAKVVKTEPPEQILLVSGQQLEFECFRNTLYIFWG